MKEILYAGFSRQSITPDYSAPLGGYGNAMGRFSEKVLDDLYMTCVAITSGEETILLFTGDILSFSNEMLVQIRSVVTKATGVPGEKTYFTATHTHSAPALMENNAYSERYGNTVATAAAATARDALADRAPAKLMTTTKRIPGMNFIRNYVMGDGSYSGSSFGSSESGYIGHAGMTDPRMILVQLKRQEKPSIMLMNWQAHNDNVPELGFRNISSSYVGKIRKKFEAETGMLFFFVAGASGNQVINSKVPAERHSLTWTEYGYRLADDVIAAMPQLQEVEGTRIKTLRVNLEVPANHAWDYMLPQAQEVVDLWRSGNDRKPADVLAPTYGFSSAYHAQAVVSLSQQPENLTLELNAFTIGDLAFITSTNEAFSEVGLHVRAYAPYDTVVFVAGNRGYLPSATAYDYRSYEADTSLYAKGTCERVSGEMVRMLRELKEQ